MPLILPGNVASATASTGYDIANSCMFNDGDSPYLSRTLGSETNRDRWTWSCWVKKCIIGVEKDIMNIPTDDDNAQFFKFTSDALRHDTVVGNATVGRLQTNRKFRDPSAWYHLVIVWDSANGTAGNRMRMYVNGVEETSFSTDTNPSSGQDSWFYSGKVVNIGRDGRGTGFFDGYMAEIVFCDGQAYAASDFGEFDEDSPTIWQPKDVSDLTFGNNGFWLDFEDSSALGNDVSGNNNDFGVTNLAAADQTTDTPTNNFATLNPLSGLISSISYAEGNLKFTNSGSDHRMTNSTIASASGKWYAEVKATELGGSYPQIGIIDPDKFDHDGHLGIASGGYGYLSNGNKQYNGSATSFGNTYATNDIIGIAMDLTNHKLYFSKNGTWENSGDPTSGATGTGSAFDLATGVFYTFGQSSTDPGTDPIYDWNFGGCPAFAISSGNADGNGYGNFEYAPPSGYYALCTKNLAEYG